MDNVFTTENKKDDEMSPLVVLLIISWLVLFPAVAIWVWRWAL